MEITSPAEYDEAVKRLQQYRAVYDFDEASKLWPAIAVYEEARNRREGNILSVLETKRVFRIESDGDTAEVYELCDECFGCTFNKQELLALADQIRDIANQLPDTPAP